MIFDYTVVAISSATFLLSLFLLKLTLTDIVRKYNHPKTQTNIELTYRQTVDFLIKRLTVI